VSLGHGFFSGRRLFDMAIRARWQGLALKCLNRASSHLIYPLELINPEVCLLGEGRSTKPRKRDLLEEIFATLRQVDVLASIASRARMRFALSE
jgi:hypothetical protein